MELFLAILHHEEVKSVEIAQDCWDEEVGHSYHDVAKRPVLSMRS